eukprot:EG_transcript_15597
MGLAYQDSPIRTSPQQPTLRFSSPPLERPPPPLVPPQPLSYYYTYPARPSVSYVSTTSYLPPPGRFSSPFVSPFSGPLYRLEDVAGSYYYSQPSSSPSLRLSTSFGSQVSYVTPPDLYPRFSQSFSSTSFQGSDRWSSGLYPMIPVMQETVRVPPPLQYFSQQLGGFSQVYAVSQALLPPPGPFLPPALAANPAPAPFPAAAPVPTPIVVPPTPQATIALPASAAAAATALPPLTPPPPVSCSDASPSASGEFGCTTRKRVNIRRGCGRCHCCVQAQARALLSQPAAGL